MFTCFVFCNYLVMYKLSTWRYGVPEIKDEYKNDTMIKNYQG